MRTSNWDPIFDPEEQTFMTIAFPTLSSNFFDKEVIFSLAAKVGKPLQINMTTLNKTRSRCAKINVKGI